MRNRLLNTMMLLAFAAASTQALADDPPAVVGRVALAQGQVTVGGDGIETTTAQVNWPVTSNEMITTARGARTELQVGSTFIRLDGDSSLEVIALDDDNLRLRLHYGSASIRIVNPDVLGGFELTTPEGRVRMQEPGRLRVDAERVADTSSVTVFEGAARVEGGGASLTLRAGKRAELQDDDVRTFVATRDAFDDWAQDRDRYAQAPAATRYVTTEMTGYSDLDRYGRWQMSTEYGPLWIPTVVAPGWAPYSDGSWVWMDQWGWTWVDNAPWGYAPFHYGRWVVVNNRWCWAPGHREHRPVWAPALVGWVGGSNWNLRFTDRHQALPARGWYPLSPHERFVPGFRAPQEHLRRWNSDVRPDFRHRAPEPRGITVVPQDQFAHRGRVPVTQAPHAAVPRQALQAVPGAAPPPPPQGRRERDARGEERRADERPGERGPGGRFDRDRFERDRFERRGDERARREAPPPVLSTQPNPVIPEHRQPPQPVTVLSAPPVLNGPQPQRPVIPEHRQPPQPVAAMSAPPVIQPGQPIQTQQPVIPEHRPPPQPVTVLSAPPVLPGQQQAQPLPPSRLQWRHEKMDTGDEPRRERALPLSPGPVPAGVAPPQAAMPAPPERPHRGQFERREMPPPVHQAPPAAPAQAAPPPVAHQFQPPPSPPPVMRQMPPPPSPAMQAPPAPRPAPAAAPVPQRAREDNARQQER
ncbi:hypothetical protein NX773_18345 [Massilia solisilvae]|uniref:FecR protein domain-containing protein n=1 Tax=Massilia solisilvae TaxID=1811225 RepID=A0ABT2BNR2_9BURK|nr:DUF6600 domain-containing protein [Massilia solisilvae]MCS0610131.1 hypothetical protein [Massilia solisilvae]